LGFVCVIVVVVLEVVVIGRLTSVLLLTISMIYAMDHVGHSIMGLSR